MISWCNPHMMRALDEARFNAAEVYFIQRFIQALDRSGLFGSQAAAGRTVAFTVPWALELAEAFRTSGQPFRSRVTAASESAKLACEELIIPLGQAHDPILTRWYSAIVGPDLSDPQVSLQANFSGEQDRSAFLARALERAWQEASKADPDFEILTRIALELATDGLAQGRDPIALSHSVAHTVEKGGDIRRALTSLLVGQQYEFSVLALVHGVDELVNLESLYPQAVQLRHTGPAALRGWGESRGWGKSHNEARKFLILFSEFYNTDDHAHPRRHSVFTPNRPIVIWVKVSASDHRSAAEVCRRELAEILDQYVAGHRLLELRIDPVMCIGRRDTKYGQRFRLEAPRRDKATPLVSHWPSSLRESMRSAHLLRETYAPMTRAGLSWAALEAAGVTQQSIPQLAKALTLQLMRQEILAVYGIILAAASAELDSLASRVKVELAGVRKLSKALSTHGARIPAPRRARIEAKHKESLEVVARLTAVRDELEAANMRDFGILHSFLNPLATTQPMGTMSHYLTQPNAWVGLLGADSSTGSPQGPEVALERILARTTPLPLIAHNLWRSRVRGPRRCLEWLESTRQWMSDLIEALYAARNMSFHAGRFQAAGDALLGHVGGVLVDLTLEFLGNWYQTKRLAQSQGLMDQPEEPAIDVIILIADRYDSLVGGLSRGVAPLSLDFAGLTSAVWAGLPGRPPSDRMV